MLRNRRILLIESGPKKEYVKTSNHNNRVVALTPMTRTLLESVNAWDFIEQTRCRAFRKMKVIENGTTASLLLERTNPKDVMGYMVENDLIVSSLMKSVEKFAVESGSDSRPGSIEVLYNSSVEKLRFPKAFSDNDLPELSVHQRDSGEKTSIKTSLLVGADGHNSTVRKASGIHTISWQHDQSAIIANLNLGPVSIFLLVSFDAFDNRFVGL